MIYGRGWWFVENPKAASCAVQAALEPFIGPTPHGMPRLSKHGIPTAACMAMANRLGVVRNPWDRMFSGWRYMRDRKATTWGMVTFEEWVMDGGWLIGRKPNPIDFCTTPQITWLSGCNTVVRFEHLHVGLNIWAERVLGQPVRLERVNASPAGPADYRPAYTPAMVDRVAEIFAPDLEAWHYDFDNGPG